MIRLYDRNGKYSTIYARVEEYWGEWPHEFYGVLNSEEEVEKVLEAYLYSSHFFIPQHIVIAYEDWDWHYGNVAPKKLHEAYKVKKGYKPLPFWTPIEEVYEYIQEKDLESVTLRKGIWAAKDAKAVDISWDILMIDHPELFDLELYREMESTLDLEELDRRLQKVIGRTKPVVKKEEEPEEIYDI